MSVNTSKQSNVFTKKPIFEKKMEDLVLSCLESRVEGNQNLYARFLIGPFFKGDALTVATALRRVLLSSAESIAITALYLQGITHEFSSIVGVRESVLELSLNFQSVVLCYDKKFYQKRSFFDDLQIGYLQVQGPKVIYANDLKLPLGVKVVNPTQYIATVSREGVLVLKFTLGKITNSLSQNSFFHTSAPTKKQAISQQLLKKNIVKAKKKCSYKNVYVLNPNLYFYSSIKRFVRTALHTQDMKRCFDKVTKSNRLQKLMSGASFVQQKAMYMRAVSLVAPIAMPPRCTYVHGKKGRAPSEQEHDKKTQLKGLLQLHTNFKFGSPFLPCTYGQRRGTSMAKRKLHTICRASFCTKNTQQGIALKSHAKHLRSNTGVTRIRAIRRKLLLPNFCARRYFVKVKPKRSYKLSVYAGIMRCAPFCSDCHAPSLHLLCPSGKVRASRAWPEGACSFGARARRSANYFYKHLPGYANRKISNKFTTQTEGLCGAQDRFKAVKNGSKPFFTPIFSIEPSHQRCVGRGHVYYGPMQPVRTNSNSTILRSLILRSPRLLGNSPERLLPVGFAKSYFSPLGLKNVFTNTQGKPKFALHFGRQGFVCRVSDNKEKLSRRAKHNLYKSSHRFTLSSCRTFSCHALAPKEHAPSCSACHAPSLHLLCPSGKVRASRAWQEGAWQSEQKEAQHFAKRTQQINYPKDDSSFRKNDALVCKTDRSACQTNEKQVSSTFLPEVLQYKSLVCVHAKGHARTCNTNSSKGARVCEAVRFARQKPICKSGIRNRDCYTYKPKVCTSFSDKKFLKAAYHAEFVMYKHAKEKLNIYSSITSNAQNKGSKKKRLFGTASKKFRSNENNNLTSNTKFSTQSVFLYNDSKSKCKLIKPIKKEKFYVFSNLFSNKHVNNPKLLEKVFPSDICLRNIIPLDSPLPPVLKVNFLIEIDDEVLYLRQKVRERIILEVWTNGSVHPRQAVHDATLSLLDIFSTFRSLYQINQYSSPLLKVPGYTKNDLPLSSVDV